MGETIVLYPAPAFGHMVSMVELGKQILKHCPDFSITVLVPSLSLDPASTSSYINQISQTTLPISFFSLSSINLPHSDQDSSSPKPQTQTRAAMGFEFFRLNVPNVIHAVQTISSTSTVLALITSAPHFTYDPSIPTYCYFTSCASALATFLYLPTIHNQTTKSFKDIADTSFHFPGLPPIKASHLPEPVLDRDNPAYHGFLGFGKSLLNSKGLILNTFDSLEPNAIKAVSDGACVPNAETPPIYCIGPLMSDAKDRAGSLYDSSLNCLNWLDGQPRGSVVFLCFGSKGAFSEAQLKEMAVGLEKSNHRFLWVLRSLSTELELEDLLPEGFLERTKNRGLVVKSWAPQAYILSHESVGGFVTHCGWNSVVEAVSYGVPMVAWPLYAEQKLNSVLLEEEMKLAIVMETSEGEGEGKGKAGFVSAEMVEKRVKQLMRLEEGKDLRKTSVEMRRMAEAAWTTDGSSFSAFSKLVGSWKKG